MKKAGKILFGGLAILTVLLCGCQRGVRVELVSGEQFPQELVGKWKADRAGWEFTFERDGSLSSAVIAMGQIELKPGRKNVVPMKLGKESVFEPGEWVVQYDSRTKELIVILDIQSFTVVMGENIVEGSSKDIIAGPVSEDGVWTADWVSYPDYIARTPEHPEFRLTDPENPDPATTDMGKLVFRKVAD
jgi:hypothetical protein